MDIFAELEKLRRPHRVHCRDNEVGPLDMCYCGADQHNETLDGIIEWLKLHHADQEIAAKEHSGLDSHVDALVIPSAPGDLSIGDYVFGCKWNDADWDDPWAVGYVVKVSKNYVEIGQEDGSLIQGVVHRGFRCAVRITGEQGSKIISEYKPREGTPFNESVMLDILLNGETKQAVGK